MKFFRAKLSTLLLAFLVGAFYLTASACSYIENDFEEKDFLENEKSNENRVLGDLVYSAKGSEEFYSVFIKEKDKYIEYLVLARDYGKCEGACLVLRKHLLDDDYCFNQSSAALDSYYAKSDIDKFLNEDFLSGFSERLASEIIEIDLEISCESNIAAVKTDIETVKRKVFLPSYTEVDKNVGKYDPSEGTWLEYFSSKESRIAYYEDGGEGAWWLRSASNNYANSVYIVGYDGLTGLKDIGDMSGDAALSGVRPAFCLNENLPVIRRGEKFFLDF